MRMFLELRGRCHWHFTGPQRSLWRGPPLWPELPGPLGPCEVCCRRIPKNASTKTSASPQRQPQSSGVSWCFCSLSDFFKYQDCCYGPSGSEVEEAFWSSGAAAFKLEHGRGFRSRTLLWATWKCWIDLMTNGSWQKRTILSNGASSTIFIHILLIRMWKIQAVTPKPQAYVLEQNQGCTDGQQKVKPISMVHIVHRFGWFAS